MTMLWVFLFVFLVLKEGVGLWVMGYGLFWLSGELGVAWRDGVGAACKIKD